MPLFSYTAEQLYHWIATKEDIIILDVRNEQDFERFSVEGPYPVRLINVSYYSFMEEEDASIAKIPADSAVRIVCAQEGSAKYVGEILEKHGFTDVGYLEGGITS